EIISVIYKIAISQDGILYAVSGKNVFKSINGADNWIDITPTINNTNNFISNSNLEWIDIDIVPDGTGNKFFIASRDFGVAGGGAQLLFSSDGGNFWANLRDELVGWVYLNYIVGDPSFESSNVTTGLFSS